MLEIQLKQDINAIVPKMIEFNNTEILQSIRQELAKYNDMTFTDDDIAEAKDIRARLNKVAKEFNSFRLQIKKQYEQPLEIFTAQVNECINEITVTADKIGNTVKDYEERKKIDKRNEIENLYNEIFGEHLVSLASIYNTKWENVTYQLKDIKQELETLKDSIDGTLETIDSMQGYDTVELKRLYLEDLSLSNAIVKYTKAQKVKETIKTTYTTQPQEETTQEKQFDFCLQVTATMKQAKDLQRFLSDNGITYKLIKE